METNRELLDSLTQGDRVRWELPRGLPLNDRVTEHYADLKAIRTRLSTKETRHA